MPTLSPGDVVTMDNLVSHKSPVVRRLIRAASAKLVVLTRPSPYLHPIEHACSKPKTTPRTADPRTVGSAVYVSTDQQREGIARRLLHHALEGCPGMGIANVLAFVFAHNMPSVTLFEAHGFGRWGLLPKICEMDGREHDVLVLGKRIQQAPVG